MKILTSKINAFKQWKLERKSRPKSLEEALAKNNKLYAGMYLDRKRAPKRLAFFNSPVFFDLTEANPSMACYLMIDNYDLHSIYGSLAINLLSNKKYQGLSNISNHLVESIKFPVNNKMLGETDYKTHTLESIFKYAQSQDDVKALKNYLDIRTKFGHDESLEDYLMYREVTLSIREMTKGGEAIGSSQFFLSKSKLEFLKKVKSFKPDFIVEPLSLKILCEQEVFNRTYYEALDLIAVFKEQKTLECIKLDVPQPPIKTL